MALYRYWPQSYGCLYVDIAWKNIFSAYINLISNLDRKGLQSQVEDLFGGAGKNLACTSVRSGLDLFLATMNFPKGSEIIFTAINIPDMPSIVESHGIKVVTVDIDLETLGPKEELLELAITDKTVAILAAHIYGKWIEMDKIIDIAHRNGLFVIEDCAECFHGFKRKGHGSSDIVFFSFGLIKYCTCLGGAIVNVKNAELLRKMRAKLELYPVQSHWLYLNKLLKYSVLTGLMNISTLQWILIKLIKVLIGLDYKEWIISLLRGYPGQILPQLRLQPSAALLKVMFDVLSNVNEREFDIAKFKGDFVGENLPDNVFMPGKKSNFVNYWLFPIVVDNPYEVMKALAKEGIEAYQGATQLRTVYKSAASAKDATNDSTLDQNDQEKFVKTLRPSCACHTSNEFHTTPEVAAGVSQSFLSPSYYETFATTRMTQEILSAANSPASYNSPTLYSRKDEHLHKQDTQHNADGTVKNSKDILYPYNAEYLINHVLYLPVHKRVPLWYLEYICIALEKIMKDRPGVKFRNGKKNIILPSKL